MTAVGSGRPGWARTAATSLVVGLATSGTIFAGLVALAPAAHAAGDGSSAVTVTSQQQDPDLATAPFPGLSVTVSQTENLVSQGIRLTYSGGKKSTFYDQQFSGADYLQVMECWGDLKDASGNLVLDQNGQPQPDRSTCQYGSANVAQGQTRYSFPNSTDLVAPEDKAAGYFVDGAWPNPPVVQVPFRSVTGKTLSNIVDGAYDPSHVNLVDNEFYGSLTTNEVPWAGFGGDGTGTATFEVQTAMQAPGLGCGNPVDAADGSVVGQSCWLVVVPRGDHDEGSTRNYLSGLVWQNWKHRLAVRLDFAPLGVRCALGAAEQHVTGSELAQLAIQAWQPVLCNEKGGSIFNVVVTSDSAAAAKADDPGVAPLAMISRPLDTATYGVDDNLTYAPVAVTGLTVAFAVDHNSDPINPPADDIKAQDQLPFTHMNLTPRLLAKLLTNSYTESLPPGVAASYLANRPANITADPDFRAVNPDWAGQLIHSPGLADVFVPLGHSDSAWAVWSYIMSDQQARDFLDGKPDEWGMTVNPWSTTSTDLNATVNPPGSPLTYPLDEFPKNDPSEAKLSDPPQSVANVITWRPYSINFDQDGYWVLRGDARKISWSNGVSGGGTGLPGFVTAARDAPGLQKVLGLTSTSSAARYQVYTAALKNPAGQFVEPTTASMTAAALAMVPDATQPQVVSFDPTSQQAKAAADAYPLTVPVYAATNADGGDEASRAAAASLIRYAAVGGQTPGTDLGQLPPGYAPLPAAWRAQALAAADKIAAGPQPEPTESPTPGPTDEQEPPDDFLPPVSPELPDTNSPPSAVETTAPAAPEPTPTPTPTGPLPPVLGATTPDDVGTGALGAAVPISAGGGLLAALAVPFVTRPRRVP